MFRILALSLFGLCLSSPMFGEPLRPAQVRAAAQRSIALLQKVGAQWNAPCHSCHHQALPAIALEAARAHGLAVDEKIAATVANQTYQFQSSIDDAVQDRFLIDPAVSEGYELWGAHASGIAPNLSLAIYARRIANLQMDDGHWPTFDGRPPHSQSLFASTAIPAAVLSYYMPASLAGQRDAALAKARQWFLTHKPASTDDAAFRLLGLGWTGASESDRKAAAQELISRRNSDGGWPQVASMPSDAYSTGETLVALRQAGLMSASAPQIQQGVAWLVKTQRPDGAWLVKTRIQTPAKVSPPYFESGFPGGHDQFLSCAATSWAVMALAESLPPAANPARPLPVTTAAPRDEQPWMRTALFGSATELAGLLDRGLDVNSATPEGTSLLMMAAGDEAKVRLLLARGANVNAQAKSGFDALLVASLFRGNRPVLHALLEKGASPKPRDNVKFKITPMMHVAFTGDVAMAEELIAHGADPKRTSMLIGIATATPMNMATLLEHAGLTRYLARHGGDVEDLDRDKMSNLSWAALMHRNESVKLLLELGANPNHVDSFGLTPLRHTTGIAGFPGDTAALLRSVTKK